MQVHANALTLLQHGQAALLDEFRKEFPEIKITSVNGTGDQLATRIAAEARAVASSRPLYNPDLELAYDDEGPEQTATAGLALTLDLSGKRRARTHAGQADLVLAEAEAALRRSGFALQWLHAWTEHGSARERVRIGEERLTLMQRFADLAERQLTVGDISSLERDLALLARDEAQAEQATLLADLMRAAARRASSRCRSCSKRAAARSSPRLPSLMRSPRERPWFWYCLATLTTKRRFAFVSFSSAF